MTEYKDVDSQHFNLSGYSKADLHAVARAVLEKIREPSNDRVLVSSKDVEGVHSSPAASIFSRMVQQDLLTVYTDRSRGKLYEVVDLDECEQVLLDVLPQEEVKEMEQEEQQSSVFDSFDLERGETS